MPMRDFLTTEDWSRSELQAMLDEARRFKASPRGEQLREKSVALLFFNPSLRTRASFDLAVNQLGGHAVVLQPGKDAWGMEFALGTVMDGDAEEHAKEAAQVLSRYVDAIGVRAFPKFQDWSEDRQDQVLQAFSTHATVPVFNMETITHPCQELAHMLTLQERLGVVQGRKYLLTWTYHPKPLNTAVANSALLIATKFGMDVTLLCPNEEYLLDPRYMNAAQANAEAQGGSLTVTHDINAAYNGAEVVYAKSWGAIPYFGRWNEESPMRERHRHFIVDEQKMARSDGALFGHCLPMRRNVKATDAVVDSANSIVIDEAENRLHVQKAILAKIVK